MVTKEKLVELKERLDDTEEAIKQEEEQLEKEIWAKYNIEELKKQLKEAEDKAWEEYDQRKKENVDKLYQTVQDTKKLLVEKVKEYNKETIREFMNKLKELISEGWQIYSVSTRYFYNPPVEKKVGDNLWTNFRPEARHIAEIVPSKTQFKYRVEHTERDKDSWGSISTKDAQIIEVELVKKIPPEKGKINAQYNTKDDAGRRYITYGYSDWACPICGAAYGKITDKYGNLVETRELPDCKHAGRLLKYGEENKAKYAIWRKVSWNSISKEFEPIEIKENS